MPIDHEQIVLRDSIIFAVGLLFVAAGLSDAVCLLTRLSWWSAAPVGVVLWDPAAALLYRHVQRTLDEMAEGTAP